MIQTTNKSVKTIKTTEQKGGKIMYKLNYKQYMQAKTLAYLAMLDHNHKEYTTKKSNKTFYTYKQALTKLMKLPKDNIIQLIETNHKVIYNTQQQNKLNKAYGKEQIQYSELSQEQLNKQQQLKEEIATAKQQEYIEQYKYYQIDTDYQDAQDIYQEQLQKE